MGASVNIASFVPERAKQRPHAAAVIFPEGRNANGKVRYSHYTYRQLDLESDRLARGLEAVGVKRGVRTVLMVRPSLEFFALTLAIFKVGAVPVLVDPGIGIRSLSTCLKEAEPEAFIGIPVAHAARVLFGWGRPTVKHTVTVGRRWFWGGPTLTQVRALGESEQPFEMADTRPEEVAAILFTSGSTGAPKGVVYRHENFRAQVEGIRELTGIREGEIDLPTFPLFALFDPALGMSSVIPDMDPTRPADVDPAKLIEAIDDFGVTTMFGSPALLDTVGRYGAKHGVRLTTLRRVISAGAPVPAAVMERFLGMLPEDAEILTPYGATESLPVACISSREVLAETAALTDAGAGVCVGHPVPSIRLEVIRVDDGAIAEWSDDLRLPRGEIGEITVRGPQVTRAYMNRPRSTELAKIEDPDGGFWHRMGDLGYRDEGGRLWFCGRKAHRVTSTEGTHYTVPVEAVFNTHPRVKRTALVGVPAGELQEPVLCVELLPEHRDAAQQVVTRELLEIGARHDHTRMIEHVLYHPAFPVDIRHNAKIGREKLARWAVSRRP